MHLLGAVTALLKLPTQGEISGSAKKLNCP